MNKEGKNFKIFGFRSDLIGDTCMALPLLNYFEKLCPNSYKIWHILGKCHQAAPLWLNHPLIEKIKISKNLESYDEEDYELMSKCDIVINTRPQHKIPDWYNYFNCVEETIQMAGIDLNHFNQVLTKEEQKPRLYRYFSVGEINENHAGYCKNELTENKQNKTISIKPFCGYGRGFNRCPSEAWWKDLINNIIDLGFKVNHYGFINEPILSNRAEYKNLTQLSFFDQIKSSLDSLITIGSDCGFMWINGAFSHKAIHLITNWQINHKKNLMSLCPANDNSIDLFYEFGSQPNQEEVLNRLKETQ